MGKEKDHFLFLSSVPLDYQRKKFMIIIATPNIDNPTPKALFIVFSEALLANFEVRSAAIRVKRIHIMRIDISVTPPPIAK